jgi:hypothetical protein
LALAPCFKKVDNPAMNIKILAIAALGLSSFALPAQAEERVLTIYGEDRCPANTICVTKPEGERYRIPKELRPASAKPANQSWAVRAQGTINEARSAPSDCNNIGAAGGWTGCWVDEMRKARAAAQADREADKALP